MGSLADVFVSVMPDMNKFEPEVKRKLRSIKVEKEGAKVGSDFGAGLHRTIGAAVTGLSGLFAGLAVVDVFSGFIDGARESARIGRLTEQVVKSTGGAARISADQVGDLATAISNKTGADDEAIQSGQNLLLTFTNVRNETGKGNDIFNQASRAATDLAAAMNNGDVSANGLKSSSIQLGKALNDPVKGVTALSKVGVSFTQQQKDQIKTLVKSGDTLAAQKIILGEVNKEFGGAAKAAADPMQRLKTIAGNLGESIGGQLLPYVDRFTSFLSGKGIPKLLEFGDSIKKGLSFSKFTGSEAPELISKGEKIGYTIGRMATIAREGFGYFTTEALPRLRAFAGFLGTDVIPKVVALGKFIGRNKDFFVPFAGTILTIIAAIRIWVGVQTALNVVLSANPIGLVVVALAALVGGLVYAYKHSETFRKVVDASFKAVVKAVLAATGFILDAAVKAFGWVPGLGPKLKSAQRKFHEFKTSVNNSLNGIKDKNVDVSARFYNGLPKTLYGVRVSGGARSSRGGITATMATGGGVHGPGTGTSDDIPAMLSNGEHVWTAREVRAAGGHGAVEGMRRSVLRGYAAGGAVTTFRDQLNEGLSRGANAIGLASMKAIQRTLQSSGFNASLAGGLNFAKSQSGKPYIWGGVGPTGYDCSGFMSAILNVVQGKRPYSRRFSTAGFPSAGFVPGPGAFSIGYFRGSPGHMAGTINGVNVESSGDRGAHYGPSARGARDSMFTGGIYHLRGYARGGGVGDAPYDVLDRRGRAYRGDALRSAFLDAMGGQVFDAGGWIPAGKSVVDNRTGGPEHLTRTNGPAMRIDPRDIKALGQVVGDVVLRGIGANNVSINRSTDRLVRGG